jgi:hypothetical protein
VGLAKRSIEDNEIALIKAMIIRGMKNKDIQFLFNRPDRPVNSGRITNIAAGTYANSKDVEAANDEDLEKFILNGRKNGSFAGVKIPIIGKVPSPAPGPVDLETLSNMFAKDKSGVWRFVAGETDQHECKLGFGFKHSGQWLKAIAALANNRGGYVLFGVHDKDEKAIDGLDRSYAVLGLEDDSFNSADPAEFAKRVKSALDPTPRFQIASFSVDGKNVGVIHVEQHPSRPVIVTRPEGDKMREGDIFFRYPGQSDRIKYSDLRGILDARDAQARRDVLPMIEKLIALGPTRALVADLSEGKLGDGERQIVIDSELVKQIKFVREGDFAQKDGALALKLVGEIKELSNGSVGPGRLYRDAVLEEDIVRNFLEQTKVERPEAYVRANLDHQRKWLPMFYYVVMAGKSPSEIADLIVKEKTTHSRKKKDMLDKLGGKLSAKSTPTTSVVRALVKAISDGPCTEPADAKQAYNLAQAVTSLRSTKGELGSFLIALQKAKEIAETTSHSGLMAAVCRAACRLDEIFFANGAHPIYVAGTPPLKN